MALSLSLAAANLLRSEFVLRVLSRKLTLKSYSISTYLATQGLKSTIIFEKTNATLAVPQPLPDFIRKSR
jgi:hypothetical protein